MRQGMNPNRKAKFDFPIPPELPVVAIITHLPDEGGYHKERRKIVEESLSQARARAGRGKHFVVWDNGSHYDFTQWLCHSFAPDAVILSTNIGISNAMRRLLFMYSDSIVALANDDIFYEQDWLVKQIEILKTYPNVGTVSGITTRYYMGKAVASTEMWARQNSFPVTGLEIPPAWDEQHGLSIGKARHEHLQEFGTQRAPQLEYNGIKAIIGGNHAQFVCYASRIAPLIPHSKRLMERLFPFDMMVDAVGLLRLLTPERTARHIGNVLTESERA